MRHLFILLLCTAACAEPPSGPTTGLSGVHPAKGTRYTPPRERSAPAKDPQLRVAPELEIEVNGVPIADETELDALTSDDVERCRAAVTADLEKLQDVAVVRTCGHVSVTYYPTTD